jgi:outer membrane immunogenic protein
MKRFLLSAAIAVASCNMNPAYAADLPIPTKAPIVVPYTTWNRVYLGINGGYGWNITGVNVDMAGTPIDLGSVPHGFMGGVQIGLDRQVSDYLVLGIIADVDVANLRGSGQAAGVISASNLTNYLGTFNARAGIPIGNHSLAFVEGGLAYGGNKPNFQVASVQAAAADTSVGWDIGGGIETKLPAFPGWSAFAKIGYMNLGSKSLTLDTGGGVLATSDNPLKFGYAKIGLNYALFGN